MWSNFHCLLPEPLSWEGTVCLECSQKLFVFIIMGKWSCCQCCILTVRGYAWSEFVRSCLSAGLPREMWCFCLCLNVCEWGCWPGHCVSYGCWGGKLKDRLQQPMCNKEKKQISTVTNSDTTHFDKHCISPSPDISRQEPISANRRQTVRNIQTFSCFKSMVVI